MADQKSRGSDRTRNWCIVVYPESAPENWRDFLDGIEWVESPLHEWDVNPTGEVKKAHWHVLLMFGGVKSYEQVFEFIAPLNCPIPQRCHNAKSAVRYMAHMDNPDKHQYDPREIVAHGGVDLAELLRPSASERYEIIRDMLRWCRENGIAEFQDLMDYAAVERPDDWFPALCDNSAFVMSLYLRSARHRSEGLTGQNRPVSD